MIKNYDDILNIGINKIAIKLSNESIKLRNKRINCIING